MACVLYIKYSDKHFPWGTFKNRAAAEDFYSKNTESFRRPDGELGKPIYVETGKGRGK